MTFSGSYLYSGYRVQFLSANSFQGHPLVSFSESTPLGGICVEGKNDVEIANIMRVIARTMTPNSKKLVNETIYERQMMAVRNVSIDNEDESLKYVFLNLFYKQVVNFSYLTTINGDTWQKQRPPQLIEFQTEITTIINVEFIINEVEEMTFF